MSLIVQKYGGTSVGSPEKIKAVAERVLGYSRKGHEMVVVLSAMSGETDRLTALANSVQDQPDTREMDVLLSTGEQVTISLFVMAAPFSEGFRLPYRVPLSAGSCKAWITVLRAAGH